MRPYPGGKQKYHIKRCQIISSNRDSMAHALAYRSGVWHIQWARHHAERSPSSPLQPYITARHLLIQEDPLCVVLRMLHALIGTFYRAGVSVQYGRFIQGKVEVWIMSKRRSCKGRNNGMTVEKRNTGAAPTPPVPISSSDVTAMPDGWSSVSRPSSERIAVAAGS